MLKKLDRYLDVQSVADVLNEKRIVILNLATCTADDSRRIIDFLSGVAKSCDLALGRCLMHVRYPFR